MARCAQLTAVCLLIMSGCDRAQVPPSSEILEILEAVPAKTSVSPAPGTFNGKVRVTLTTDRPAEIRVSVDGSDPHQAGAGLSTGSSVHSLELTASTTLTFYSRTPEGTEEALQTATFVRAGAEKGTISGVIVVGPIAVDQELALSSDGQLQPLGKVNLPSEVPFTVTGLESGPHRLSATADRNGDGQFWPLVDYASDTTSVTLDLSDPYKASLEGLRIYLGASAPGLGTIAGTVMLPEPADGQDLSVTALSGDILTAFNDPTKLLSQLQGGYRVFTRSPDTRYPYAITDLTPARYIPTPVLTGFGAGGLAMNFMINPFRSVEVEAGKTANEDFTFGPVALSGTVTINPASPPQGLVYGIVAAKHSSLTEGLQAVLMPTVFLPGTTGAGLSGHYAGKALRENSTFQLRVFSSLDAANPITAALGWVLNPFAPEPPHSQVKTGGSALSLDVNVP